jgi:hypothetical protein
MVIGIEPAPDVGRSDLPDEMVIAPCRIGDENLMRFEILREERCSDMICSRA